MNKKEKQARASEAVVELRRLVKEGDTVFTSLRQVSASGMSRHIFCFIAIDGNENSKGKPYIYNITHLVGTALGYKVSEKTGALVAGGCGMDMGYHVVSSLAFKLGYTTNGAQSAGNCYGLSQSWL